MKTIIAITAALLLAGCAGAVPWNAQNYAGITHVDAQWRDDGTGLERVRVWQGKEAESFDITADLKSGTVTWSGKEVRAFEGFRSRAEVEQFVAEKFADAAPEIRGGLVDVIARLAGL